MRRPKTADTSVSDQGAHGGDDVGATRRYAGRERKEGDSLNIQALIGYLREAEHHHVERRAQMPEQHWSDWYAADVDARGEGTREGEARDQPRGATSSNESVGTEGWR
jgi:hypothetical protein